MTATTQMTQTGEDDMPEYISIYDNKPKKKMGRPISKQTDDEQKVRMRKTASTHYYENIEKRRLQQALNYQRVKNEKAQNALIL